jgi:hypothetical protein
MRRAVARRPLHAARTASSLPVRLYAAGPPYRLRRTAHLAVPDEVQLVAPLAVLDQRPARLIDVPTGASLQQIHAHLKPQSPTPDLVIYLQAERRTLTERVARRANPVEASITPAYLEALADSYTRFFHDYDAAPLLVVNTEHLNPIDRDADFELLLSRIEKMRGRREHSRGQRFFVHHFFHPKIKS